MKEIQYITKFKIIREIAIGGMGEIYLAEQIGSETFRKTVAIKVIKESLVSDQDTMKMFVGEAKLVADLIHENIVQVYNFEKIEDDYYLIMEYADGPNLESFMNRHRFMNRHVPVDIAAFIISRVARGLAYIHNKRDKKGDRLKIVHRDISPSNIIMTYQGGVKLIDFGIAKALHMKLPDEREILMGKYPYMSPEQVQGEITDFRSDIFSLGLVGYELLTGKQAYDSKDAASLLQSRKQKAVEPQELNSAIPAALNQIIMRALAFQPQDRFLSASEMRESLEHFLYDKGFGPTSETLAQYLDLLFPEAKKQKMLS